MSLIVLAPGTYTPRILVLLCMPINIEFYEIGPDFFPAVVFGL